MATDTSPMRKLLNEPEAAVRESLAGLAAAHGDLLRYDAEAQILVRTDAPRQGKVALTSGGGAGHEPAPRGAGAGQGRPDQGRGIGPGAAARRLRRARDARRGVSRRGLHLAGARPD